VEINDMENRKIDKNQQNQKLGHRNEKDYKEEV
jgi:hypothetical protein